jgi:YVTN family beta-propeller protein
VSLLTRRGFLSATSAGLASSCKHRKAEGFPGYAFVANSAGGAVAVVDLGAFAAVRHIRLEADPFSLLSHPNRPIVYALTPANGCIHEIDTETLALARSTACSSVIQQMQLAGGGADLWVLAQRRLFQIRTQSLELVREIGLPGVASEFDLAPDGRTAAISIAEPPSVVLVDLDTGATVALAPVEGSANGIRFRSDGRQVILANRARRVLSVLDPKAGGWIVHLPLSVTPDHLCFKPDGGQLFVTGAGLDAVVTVHPFETQVASTTLAGRAPGAMTASSAHLFITNPESGDVTVLDIDTQRVVAAVAVGRNPGFVAITPDEQYALVLNRDSGDLAVIRIASLTGRRRRSAPLFTMVPVGSNPVHAVVRAV